MMNKTLKHILYGAGCFVGVFLIIVIVRCLLRGVAFEEELKDWTNWLIAACSAASGVLTSINNEKKKAAENKGKKEN